MDLIFQIVNWYSSIEFIYDWLLILRWFYAFFLKCLRAKQSYWFIYKEYYELIKLIAFFIIIIAYCIDFLYTNLMIELILLFALITKCSPKRPHFIFKYYKFSVWDSEYRKVLLVFDITKIIINIVFILDEKSSFKEIQNPISKTIWTLHINPHRGIAFELIIFIQPTNLVRSHKIIRSYYFLC